MGKALFMIDDIEQAQKYLKKVIDLNPNSDEAYFHTGLILRKKGHLKDAENLFLKALSLQPNNANVHNNLGVTLLEQGRFQEAKEFLNKALEIYPEHINARYNLGMSFWGMGEVEDAIKQYRHVLELKPKWAIAANSLAWILATDRNEHLRDGKEAIHWALVACAGDGRKNPDYLDTLAAAYAEAGYFEQAIKVAEECLTLAEAVGDIDLSHDVTRRIQLYRNRRPFHE
jgi:Flp pilus assembly protein TadD